MGGENLSTSVTAPICYRIDGADRLISFNDEWTRFALSNDGTELASKTVLGRSLWSFISGHGTREIYRLLVGRVRTGADVEFDFACDSPDVRRLATMTIRSCAEREVEFIVSIRSVTQRINQVSVLDRSARRGTDLLVICAWCSRLQTDRLGWIDIEEAAVRLRLFESDQLPVISHGMCPDCYHRMSGVVISSAQSRSARA